MKKNEKMGIAIAGAIIGVIAALLVLFGNPTNMGYCIACFLRDTAGGLKLHSAAVDLRRSCWSMALSGKRKANTKSI